MTAKISTARSAKTWGWRRWIAAGQQELWILRMQEAGCTLLSFTERPGAARVLLNAYPDSRAEAIALARRWGGSIAGVDVRKWMTARPAPPTRIGSRLEIIHAKARGRIKPAGPQLHVPHGLAFGSGEHATTFMLLRELGRRGDLSKTAVLDLGTGSGVLALAARLFGARKIVATDFDPDSIRTARQNEALNFPTALIRWRRGDVKQLRPTTRYDLVLANLFSGILCEAAPPIAASVAPGGELWLSGILVEQEAEVVAAYRREGLRLRQARRRGKWVMLLLRA
jgi:ribosomal protein L11 methyltransferase